MNKAPMALRHFFFPEEDGFSREQRSILEARPEFGEFKQRLTAQFPTLDWGGTAKQVVCEMAKVFDVSLTDILVRTWNNLRILHKYRNRENYPPGDTIFLHFHEHTLKSEHKPSVEVLINGAVFMKIPFHIILALTLKGLILKIQDARIKEITPISCEGKGTVKCWDLVMMEKKTQAISLLGAFDLGEGIPIGA